VSSQALGERRFPWGSTGSTVLVSATPLQLTPPPFFQASPTSLSCFLDPTVWVHSFWSQVRDRAALPSAIGDKSFAWISHCQLLTDETSSFCFGLIRMLVLLLPPNFLTGSWVKCFKPPPRSWASPLSTPDLKVTNFVDGPSADHRVLF